MRNEVGIRFDNESRLWGVENGCDDVARSDLGGDIHTDNPSEEMNFFAQSGRFYGYPFCFSEYLLPAQYAKGAGTQWVHPSFQNDGVHTDAWCRDPTKVVKPAYNFPAHWAPLDILFYYSGSFPAQYQGGAFVAAHGSWDRNPPAGYRVAFVNFSNKMPVSHIDFLYHAGSQPWPNGFRPVGLAFAKCKTGQCLYVSSDSTGQIVEISYGSK